MAKQFSPKDVSRINRAVKKTERSLSSAGRSPIDGYDFDLWLKITESTEIGEMNKYNYSVEVYACFKGESALASGQALNTYEDPNTETEAMGEEIKDPDDPETECSDAVGVRPIPNGVWVKASGYQEIDGQWKWLFTLTTEIELKGNG